MLKKTILLVAILGVVGSTFAQGTNFGIRAGLNLASMEIDEENAPELSSTVGFHVGAIADIGLNNFFYIQPGLFLSTKGSKYHYPSGKHEATTSLWYLEIPLLASAKIAINESLAPRINIGPYVGFGIAGATKHEYYGSETGPDSEKAFRKDYYKRLDIGLAFGGGIEFQSFYLGVNYDLGLASIADSKIDIYNRCLGFTLGYNF